MSEELTWTMKDGRTILIKDMSDSHVQNTLNLLKRVEDKIQEELSNAYAISCMVIGEMASYYIEYDIQDIEDQLLEISQKIKIFEKELQNRKNSVQII